MGLGAGHITKFAVKRHFLRINLQQFPLFHIGFISSNPTIKNLEQSVKWLHEYLCYQDSHLLCTNNVRTWYSRWQKENSANHTFHFRSVWDPAQIGANVEESKLNENRNYSDSSNSKNRVSHKLHSSPLQQCQHYNAALWSRVNWQYDEWL